MVRDTLCMCLELKGARTFWDSIVSPVPIPTRPQKESEVLSVYLEPCPAVLCQPLRHV